MSVDIEHIIKSIHESAAAATTVSVMTTKEMVKVLI